MADVFNAAKRSEVMSRIRAKGNASTELRAIALFRELKATGWRRHQKLFGNPDFVFRKVKTAVFIDGCFWHQCPRCGLAPKQNGEFWSAKLAGNRKRDRLVNARLRESGWKVTRIWEHELKNGSARRKLIRGGLIGNS